MPSGEVSCFFQKYNCLEKLIRGKNGTNLECQCQDKAKIAVYKRSVGNSTSML